MQIIEGIVWATGGIYLNMAGALWVSRLYLPGIILSMGGLLMMTLALSAGHRDEDGVLGTSRDGQTFWALRLAGISSLIMGAAGFGVLFDFAVAAQMDVALLALGGVGLLVSGYLLIRLFRR